MSFTISDLIVETLERAGVRRVYGLPGDSLNGFTDALRRNGNLVWEHVRHEAAAAFAAAGEAAVTGELAVCANPDFAAVARALGMHGQRVERPDDLAGSLRAAFDHDGCALVEVMTARQELSLPPTITLEQIKGFTLYATRTVLSGRGDELIDLAKTNVTRRLFS